MKAKSALIASIATVGIASAAHAQNYTSTGGPFAISGGPHVIDIVITDSYTITDLDVTTLWASHGWMGDINATITHVNTATTVSLFGRVGGGSLGDSSDLIGAYRFDDEAPAGAPGDFWAAAAAVGGASPVAPGSYRPTANLSNTVTFLNVFDGQNIQGTWRLTLNDTFPASTPGTLTSFTIHAVPAPSALALLGLAGVAGRGRRRARA